MAHPPSLDTLFQQFLRERTYVENVTAKTREWYETAWHAYQKAQPSAPPLPVGRVIDRPQLEHFVQHMRDRGVTPVSCNCWLRAMNSFCRWLHDQGGTDTVVHLRLQGVEKPLIRTFDDTALRRLVGFKPKTFAQVRVHALACVLVDTGCRMHEVLRAPVDAFDFDDLLLTVRGKGRKERRVPFSIELRKVLFRWGSLKDEL
jgi:site-specific recombinase XerD